jgi:outer membrane lipoprotein-sorting protein
MFRLRTVTLGGCVFAAAALLAHGQENDLKDVIRKAITAHGGKEKLAKFKAARSKFKGNIEVMGMTLPITGETTFLLPNKLRNDMSLDINGVQLQIVQVYDGKTMWISQMGQTKELKDEKTLKETREQLQAEGGAGLINILDGTYELSAVGDVKVKDKDAVGIRISKKGQRDYSIFIDKKTNLIVKTEMRVLDTIGQQEVTQEKYFLDYRDRNGLKSPARIVMDRDGKLFMDVEITESEPFETLDDATFAMP